MKKFLLSLLIANCSLLVAPQAHAIPWWEQPTICKPNTANCYPSMGAGYDVGMWDATGNCWGLKMVCAGATTGRMSSEPIAMGKADITAGLGINSDFDTNILNGDCFGTRKTTANGTRAASSKYTGTGASAGYVNVWCNGILDNPDEQLANGEISLNTQPTCKDLAQNGFVGVLNGKCYGKYFDPAGYYIECSGSNELPDRLVVLNGATDTSVGAGAQVFNYPTTASAAQSLFDQMQSISTAKRSDHFN
ncbi:MAG: hypothetical protein LBJ18_02270 [Rickettsiales bacterium]|jgi:hypothetical protein|nr:hypothetical protein [Rickettsiales bacterium]